MMLSKRRRTRKKKVFGIFVSTSYPTGFFIFFFNIFFIFIFIFFLFFFIFFLAKFPLLCPFFSLHRLFATIYILFLPPLHPSATHHDPSPHSTKLQ